MNDEAGASPRIAIYSDLSAVSLNNRPHQPQTQTQARLGAALISAKQTIPDMGEVFGGYAGARIPDGHYRLFPLPAGGDRDRSLLRGVLDRIVEQIGDDLTDPI